MKSFSLLRTNPALTTNATLVVSGNSLFLESIDSREELSSSKYKHVSVDIDTSYDVALSNLWSGLPNNLVYHVANEDTKDVVWSDFKYQYDDLYKSGFYPVKDQWYSEEHEFFCPLYLGSELPDGMLIFRVDGLGLQGYDENSGIREQVLANAKLVSYTDMSEQSTLGTYLRNYTSQQSYPKYPMTLDYKSYEWSYIHGINYQTGGFTSVGLMLDREIDHDQPYFRFEEYFTDIWKDYGLVYPKIMNLKFLFNDNPGTPDRFRKYSINRYFGFYVDKLEQIQSFTPYIPPYNLFLNLTIENNYFVDSSIPQTIDGALNPLHFVDPFIGGWKQKVNDGEGYWVWYSGDYFKVERDEIEVSVPPLSVDKFPKELLKITTDSITLETIYKVKVTRYRIQSEMVLNIPVTDLNKKDRVVQFKHVNGKNTLIVNNSAISLDSFQDGTILNLNDGIVGSDRINFNVSDVYIAEIAGRKFILNYEGQNGSDVSTALLYINSDSAIDSDYTEIRFRKGGFTESLRLRYDGSDTFKPSLKDDSGKPLTLKIYRVSLTDVKDFDFDRKVTKYSEYEFEHDLGLVDTLQGKFYLPEVTEITPRFPREEPVHPRIDSQYQDKAIPASSEYMASEELFEHRNDRITRIWDKNQSICKWGYASSYDISEQPYRFNSSLLSGLYNRGVNIHAESTSKANRTHDWFLVDLPPRYGRISRYMASKFSFVEWSDLDVDYASYYFTRDNQYDLNLDGNVDYIEPVRKQSMFNVSGTVFRGVKYSLDKIDNIKLYNGRYEVSTLNYNPAWHFSTLMTFTKEVNDTGEPRLRFRILVDEIYGSVIFNLDFIIPGSNPSYTLVYNNYDDKYLNIYQTLDFVNGGYQSIEKIYSEGITYTSPDGNITFLSPDNTKNLCVLSTSYMLNNCFNLNTSMDVQYVVKTTNGIETYLKINDWKFNGKILPYYLRIDIPVPFNLYTQSVDVDLVQGAKLNPKRERWLNYQPLDTTSVLTEWLEDEPLARTIKVERATNFNKDYTLNDTTTQIVRYSGEYDVIYKTVPLFENYNYNILNKKGNYRFREEYSDFGIGSETIYSKVSRNKTPLQLADSSTKSLYPRADEWGLAVKKMNIFTNQFDPKYYTEVE